MYTFDVAETAYHASQQRATKSAEFSRSKLTSAGEPEILSEFIFWTEKDSTVVRTLSNCLCVHEKHILKYQMPCWLH